MLMRDILTHTHDKMLFSLLILTDVGKRAGRNVPGSITPHACRRPREGGARRHDICLQDDDRGGEGGLGRKEETDGLHMCSGGDSGNNLEYDHYRQSLSHLTLQSLLAI